MQVAAQCEVGEPAREGGQPRTVFRGSLPGVQVLSGASVQGFHHLFLNQRAQIRHRGLGRSLGDVPRCG